jgi:hypothetical protein
LEIANRLTVGNLDEAALKVVERVRLTYASRVQVPCTQCGYCVPCPHGVEIPRVFNMYNRAHIFDIHETIREQYHTNLEEQAKASNCVACGQCEPKCPQNIEIINMLSRIALEFKR